jgi:hypothetical protein
VSNEQNEQPAEDPRVTHYRCTNPTCDATDKDHGNNPPTPVTLICHKCRGEMFPVSNEARQ